MRGRLTLAAGDLSDRASALRMRTITRVDRRTSCSQIRSTRQPRCRSVRVTKRSRTLFAVSFLSQNPRLFAGMFECFGQPCQKQPSTKITTRSLRNVKSGRPGSAVCRRHPVMAAACKSFTRASSVSLLPRPRMRDITCERFAVVKTSGMVLALSLRGSRQNFNQTADFSQSPCRVLRAACPIPSRRRNKQDRRAASQPIPFPSVLPVHPSCANR